MTSKRQNRRQVAALPWRRSSEHGLQILLITSRETRRWIIPKGWLMPDRSAAEAAAQEAYEEAGVKGVVSPTPLGVYCYEKRLTAKKARMIDVSVFPLEVLVERLTWPEQSERQKQWLTPREATEILEEPNLTPLLIEFLEQDRAS